MKKEIRIIGVPMDLGQSQRGVDMGPGAIRYAGLSSKLRNMGYPIEDIGNIPVKVRDSLHGQNFLPAIQDVCEKTYAAGHQAVADGRLPLFLGGDHSISIGTIGGITHDKPTGVIWIDAHGDFNIPSTSQSSNIHGMALAVLTGRGLKNLVDIGRPGAKLKPDQVILLGVRELDPEERVMLRDSGIEVYTMRDIDEQGCSAIAQMALDHLSQFPRLHVSLDMDSLDPKEAPGVGTPVSGGLTTREAHLIMEIIADSKRLSSMDVVEINPILDQRNNTAKIAVDLIVSVLGKSIL